MCRDHYFTLEIILRNSIPKKNPRNIKNPCFCCRNIQWSHIPANIPGSADKFTSATFRSITCLYFPFQIKADWQPLWFRVTHYGVKADNHILIKPFLKIRSTSSERKDDLLSNRCPFEISIYYKATNGSIRSAVTRWFILLTSLLPVLKPEPNH